MASDDDSTVRITMRIPIETKDELYEMCERFGVRPTNVFPVALMIGMRTLAQSFSLAETRELWDELTNRKAGSSDT